MKHKKIVGNLQIRIPFDDKKYMTLGNSELGKHDISNYISETYLHKMKGKRKKSIHLKIKHCT